jgi:RNA 2',3'-cyclic 3'-phosphodiesterase
LAFVSVRAIMSGNGSCGDRRIMNGTESDGPHRLFLALWPDEAAVRRIRRVHDAWTWPDGARLLVPADWHVTLHFLGAMPVARSGLLADALQVPIEPFDIELTTPQVWHHGLAVLIPQTVPDALRRLHAALAEAIAQADGPVEGRDYRPHLTLARHAQGAQPPAAVEPVCWRAGGYVLAQSCPGSGRRYRIVRRYPAPG